MQNSVVFSDSYGNGKIFQKLIDVSYKNYIDVDDSLDWAKGVDRTRMPKDECHMWLYGTPYFDMLTQDQKLEMAWLEVARDVSLFIHFEQIIPQVFSQYIAKYKHQMDRRIYEYMMIFEREELSHILMFHRFLDVAELPWYEMSQSYDELAKKLPDLAPEEGIIYTLFIEWTSENAVVASIRGADVDPLTAELWTVHHEEEARHIAFGKKIGEAFFDEGDQTRINMCRIQYSALVSQLHYVYNFNPEIQRYLSFDLPFDVEDQDIIHAIRTSDHNKRLNQDRFASILKWCESLSIL